MDLSQDDIAALDAEFGGTQPQPSLSQDDMAALDAEFGSVEPAQQPDKINTRTQSAISGLADAASWGLDDELRGTGRGIGRYLRDGGSFTDQISAGIDSFRDEQKQAATDNPLSYIGGQVAGSIAGVGAAAKPLASVEKLVKYARTKPLRAAAGLGAAQGGIYGFNSGEGGIGERGRDAVYTAGVNAMLAPAGAAVGQKVGNVLIGKGKPKNTISKVQEQPLDLSKKKYGDALPLTEGQASQNLERQAMEITARKGGYGDDAAQAMRKVDSTQQGAMRQTLNDLGAGSEDDLVNVGKQVKNAYKSQKAKVSAAYDNADIIDNVYVNKKPIAEVFAPKFNETLKKYNLDEVDLSDEGKRVFKAMNSSSFKSDKITSFNLRKMESWRGKVSNIVANNNAVKGNASEGAAMRQVLEEYDTFMAKLPEDALKSGDETALNAIIKARGERRKQGLLFERDKVVKGIVQNQDLTDEELANIVLTGSGRSKSVNSSSGRIVKNLKRAVGDNAPALQDGLKRGVLARMLNNGTETTLDDGIRKISPHKLRKEFDNLVANKTFMKELFTPDEISQVDAIRNDLTKIASVQNGADNYSNTAYALMRFVNIMPGGKTIIGDSLAGLGDKAATKNIKKGLSPILDDMISELSTTKRFYGATTAAPISKNIQQNLTEE